MLLLNGTLDPQTPLEFALEIAPNYTQPRQTFVAIDRAVHGSVLSSPTIAPPHTPCGLALWMSFTKDPGAPVDTSCVAEVMPLRFEGSAAMAQQLLGTGDLWENGAAASAAAGASLASADAEAVRRAAEALRRTYQRARQRLALTAD